MTTFVLKNLRWLFDKYAAGRTEHDAHVKSTTKIFFKFCGLLRKPKLYYPTCLYQISWARERQYLKVFVSPIWGRRGLKRPKKVFTTKIAKNETMWYYLRKKTTQISPFSFTSLRWWLKLLFFCFPYSEKCVRTAQSQTSIVLTDRKRAAQIFRAKTLRFLRQS